MVPSYRRGVSHVALLATVVIGVLLTLWSQGLRTQSVSGHTWKLNGESAAAPVSSDSASQDDALQWSNVFPGTNFTVGDLSPLQFRALLSRMNSQELTAALQRGELKGRDIREWLRSQQNITLEAGEDEMDLSDLAELYGYDNVAAYSMQRAFAGSELYHWVEDALCSILPENGTHVLLLGDSTVQGLNGIITSVARQCEAEVTVSRTTRKTNEIVGEEGTSFYHERAYNPRFEHADYSVPKGTKRTLVVANFDALHALSIFPGRQFKRMFDGRRFFDAFGDFVRYQLWQISRLPTDTYMVTLNVNSVDHRRMKGNYAEWITRYYNDTEEYTRQCAKSWGVPASTCRNGILANAGSEHLSQVIDNIVPVNVDVNAMTRDKGYATPMMDGRHYKSLAHLKLVQIVAVYMLQRIDRCLEQQTNDRPGVAYTSSEEIVEV